MTADLPPAVAVHVRVAESKSALPPATSRSRPQTNVPSILPRTIGQRASRATMALQASIRQ